MPILGIWIAILGKPLPILGKPLPILGKPRFLVEANPGYGASPLAVPLDADQAKFNQFLGRSFPGRVRHPRHLRRQHNLTTDILGV